MVLQSQLHNYKCSYYVKIYGNCYTVTGCYRCTGYDYIQGTYSARIPRGKTSVSVNVRIIDDNYVERNETFNLAISSSSLPYYITAGNIDSTTITIVDNESKYTYI